MCEYIPVDSFYMKIPVVLKLHVFLVVLSRRQRSLRSLKNPSVLEKFLVGDVDGHDAGCMLTDARRLRARLCHCEAPSGGTRVGTLPALVCTPQGTSEEFGGHA